MRRFLISLVVALGLAGCAGAIVTPESPREKLVAAEAVYKVALLQVKSLIANGVILPETKAARTLATLIGEARLALDTWHLTPDDLSPSVLTKHALDGLRRYLITLIPTLESHYEPCGHPWNSACLVLA